MDKKTLKLNVGDVINFDITAIGEKGDGIGFYNGLAVIVPDSKIDVNYDVKITAIKNKFAFGEIVG